MNEEYQNLHEIVGFLLNQHTGKDEIEGLKKADLPFAKSLYDQKQWSIRQANAIFRMIKKYEDQLQIIHNFDYEKLKPVESQVDPIWTASFKDNRVYLYFNSNDKNIFFKTLNDVKDLTGREYDKVYKIWHIPLSVSNIKRVIALGFIPDKKVTDWLEENTSPEFLKQKKEKYDPDKLIAKVKIPELRQFQKEGIAFIEEKDNRGLIADEMGLGKTLQALVGLKLHPEKRPAVIVVPASLKLNWKKEIEKWLQLDSIVLTGRKGDSEVVNDPKGIYIINYDIIANVNEKTVDKEGKKKYKEIPESGWIDFLCDIQPEYIIMDEVHRIKNSKAFRTKAVKRLCKGVDNIVGLSGTPLLNKPIELFNICNILRPDVFPSWYRFGQRYCNPSHNGFGMQYDGSSNAEELHDLLTEHIMIRRRKKDVLKELPDKQRILISFPITNRKEYSEAEEDIIRFIHEQEGLEAAKRASRAETLAKFSRLKQLASQGKMDDVVEWVTELIESGEKVVLFAVHKKIVSCLMKRFEGIAVKIDGSCSSKARQDAVDSFQNDENIRLFIGNIVAASEGITLTAASITVTIELPWTPALCLQAEDRVHRIGQENAVMNYYLLSENTIEEDIAKAIDSKQQVIDAVIDGEETEDEQLLTLLWEKYKNK